MRIITCIKCVPNVLKTDTTGQVVLRDNVVTEINPSDMFAVEEAVRIKEKISNSEAIGLSMGVPSTEEALKKAVAMGLDEIYLLSDKHFAGSDTLATSYILSCAISKLGKYDLILCGKQSSDGDTGQVPQELSTKLGVPCIINVVGIELQSDKAICTVLEEDGYYKYISPLPAVLSVLKGINTPRIPTISKLLYSKQYSIRIINAEKMHIDITKCGISGSPTRVLRVFRHSASKRKAVDISERFHDSINELMKRVLSERHQDSEKSSLYRPRSQKAGKSEIWVVCELRNNILADVSLQLLAKAYEISESNGGIVVAVIFCKEKSFAEQLARYGAEKIIQIMQDNEYEFNEAIPASLCEIASLHKPEIILFGGTIWGHWIAPLVSSSLSTGLTADCFDLRFEKGLLVQTRVALGGNLIAEILCPEARPQMATVRPGIFQKKECYRDVATEIIKYSPKTQISRIKLISKNTEVAKQEYILSEAKIIVAGGKGIGSKTNFQNLFKFAKLIGGAVAASRYAVDAGWVDYQHQVGQTGITVRPKLYIAFGVSGATEHIIGMRDAECIITVNTDREAPLVNIADYCIYDDCNQVLIKLINAFCDLNRRFVK